MIIGAAASSMLNTARDADEKQRKQRKKHKEQNEHLRSSGHAPGHSVIDESSESSEPTVRPWQDIAKELAAQPWFMWREGMQPRSRHEVEGFPYGRMHSVDGEEPDFLYPDLTDWATTGVLMGVLHDSCKVASLGWVPDGDGNPLWEADAGTLDTYICHPVHGAAVALALMEFMKTTEVKQ